MTITTKTVYLDDGVYVTFTDDIELYVDRDDGTRHQIYLTPQMVQQLAELVKKEYV